MSDHLSQKEIDSLSNRTLRGKGLFAALKHLETCEKCRSQIKLPTREEILKRFEADEDLTFKTKLPTVSHK